MRTVTRVFTVRIPIGERKLKLVHVPYGLPCTVSRPRLRHDTGKRLMENYRRVDLDEPFEGVSTFYTDYHNVAGWGDAQRLEVQP